MTDCALTTWGKTMKIEKISLHFLAFLFLFSLSLNVWAQGSTQDIDAPLVNANFQALLTERLDNFSQPSYIAKIKEYRNAGIIDVKIISLEKLKEMSAQINPFVRGNTIFIGLIPKADKEDMGVSERIVAMLDGGDLKHEEMLRGLDMMLLALNILLEDTSRAKVIETMKYLDQISKIESWEERRGVGSKLLDLHFNSKIKKALFAASFTIKFVFRFNKVHPGHSLESDLKGLLDKEPGFFHSLLNYLSPGFF